MEAVREGSEIPRFPQGYELRLRLTLSGRGKLGKVEAYFYHQHNPLQTPLVFVELEQSGSRGGAELVYYTRDTTPPGEYRLHGLRIENYHTKREELVTDFPETRFVVTDRRGNVPKPASRRATLSWG